MQIAGQLSELLAGVLLLVFLFLLSDLAVVFVQVAADFLVLSLYILQILLASVEIVFPSPDIVATIAERHKASQKHESSDKERCPTSLAFPLLMYLQFLYDSCHLRVIAELALLIASLFVV